MFGILDATADETYAAVGLALSRWEELEVGLADLYSLFVGTPTDLRVIQGFCDGNRVFAARLATLERAATAYFIRDPSQAYEGWFRAVAVAAGDAALNRNRIAHGLVQRVCVHEQSEDGLVNVEDGYALAAPWYAMKRLRLEPDDGLGSVDIDRISKRFIAIEEDAVDLLNALIR